MPIKNLAYEYLPREKAQTQGLSALTDAELLAIFIRNGYYQTSVIKLGQELLNRFYSLAHIDIAPRKKLEQIKGIGPTKALEIKALFEFARRVNRTDIQLKIQSPNQAVKFAVKHMKLNSREEFLVVFLNRLSQVIYYEIVYRGTEEEMAIKPKEILALGLQVGAAKFYCFHNHPSSNIKPSTADKNLTFRLKYYSDLLEIKLLGHLILNKNLNYHLIKI